MNTSITPQSKMDAAFDNYFALSEVLQSDLNALLDSELASPHWRRNYVCLSFSLIEGYLHCLREMCAVSLECIAPEISKKELEFLQTQESRSDMGTRIKRTLDAVHKLFDLQPAAKIDGPKWASVQCAIKKRNSITHPKNITDLELTEESWLDISGAIGWLLEIILKFSEYIKVEYSSSPIQGGA